MALDQLPQPVVVLVYTFVRQGKMKQLQKAECVLPWLTLTWGAGKPPLVKKAI